MKVSRMLLTIFAFLIILSILVIVHELGHFLVAKYFGVEVQEFGLGFPPRAKTIHTSKDGVNWTLNWLPIGGFVKLKGEDGSHSEEPTSFAHKEPWKRTIILSAGVVMNILLAFILLSIGYATGWPEDLTENTAINSAYIEQKKIIISFVEKNTPAQAAGIKRGDVIKTVDGQPFVDVAPLQQFILNAEGKEILVEIDRGNVVLEKKVTPEKITFIPGDGEGGEDQNSITKVGIGVGLRELGIVRYPIPRAFLMGIKNTVVFSGKIVMAFYNLLRDLIVTHKVSKEIGGPIMIATLSGHVARLGISYIVQFIALLSLNLAIVNILPFPALDGGRILFVFIEKLKGRAVSMHIESWFHSIGFWILISLTILITIRDVARLQIWERIKDVISL